MKRGLKRDNKEQHSNKQNINTKIYPNISSLQKSQGYSNIHNHQKNIGKSIKQASQSKITSTKVEKTRALPERKRLANLPPNRRNLSTKNLHCGEKAKILRQIVKFPKIKQEDASTYIEAQLKDNKKRKKVKTEACQEYSNDQKSTILLSTTDPNNMKDALLGIVKNRQNRHLMSIDEEIDKLNLLTKRYSCLRHDLALIQQDILTISFKDPTKKSVTNNTSNSGSYLFQ